MHHAFRPPVVVGRFPPPLDGQAVATRTLAELLADGGGDAHHSGVRRVDLSAPEAEVRRDEPAWRRMLHYLGTRRRIRAALADAPGAPVLWTTISPKPLGHLRDRVAVASAFGRGRAVLALVHHGDFDRLFRHPATRGSAARLIGRLRGLVFLSEALAGRCAPWVPAAKRFVVPNTTAADTHLPREAWHGLRTRRADGEPLRLLYLSGMIPDKGYRDVLDAVGVLAGRGVPVRATFAGRWPSDSARRSFEARVGELGVGERVQHLGSVSDRGRVRRLYLDADAFLLPTTYPTEAQPLTILEALNAGTPVVATAHASIPEMIDDGRSGLLVPPHRPAALADAVERLRPAEVWGAFSDAARARYEAAFAPDAVRRRWLDLLGSLGPVRP